MSDKKWLWHRRLGHANWRLISKLSKLQLVRGLPDIDYHSDALCGACQKGKIVKTVRTKGVSQNHLLSFDDNKVLKNYQLDMLNICSSVQDPNQSTIHKDFD